MSDRVALMSQGRILQFATPAELYDRPASLAVAQFIGSPAINCLDIDDTGGRLMSEGAALPALRLPAGVTPHTLAVRPEDLRPTTTSVEAAQSPGLSWPARIERIEHHGAERIMEARLLSGTEPRLFLRVSAAEAAQLDLGEGAQTRLRADVGACHFFAAGGARIPTQVAPRMPAVATA